MIEPESDPGHGYVLTRDDGQPVRDFRGAWQKVCIGAGIGRLVCRKCEKQAEPIPTKLKRRGELGAGYRCPECHATKYKAFRYVGLIVHDFRRSAAKASRRAGVPESVIMAMGGWKTPAMFRRYVIVSSADQRAAVEMIERARAQAVDPHTTPFSTLEPEKAASHTERKLQ